MPRDIPYSLWYSVFPSSPIIPVWSWENIRQTQTEETKWERKKKNKTTHNYITAERLVSRICKELPKLSKKKTIWIVKESILVVAWEQEGGHSGERQKGAIPKASKEEDGYIHSLACSDVVITGTCKGQNLSDGTFSICAAWINLFLIFLKTRGWGMSSHWVEPIDHIPSPTIIWCWESKAAAVYCVVTMFLEPSHSKLS